MKKLMLFITFTLLFSSCSEIKKTYQVKWLNYDGTTLEIDYQVAEGSTPSYDSETPHKNSDGVYDYTFLGWDKEITPIYNDMIYTATFKGVERKGIVVASHDSGFYNENFYLSFSAPSGFDIYYSLDNSYPNIKYESPVLISDTSSKPNYYS